MFTIHSWNYTEKTKNLLYGNKNRNNNLGVPPAKQKGKQDNAGVGLFRVPLRSKLLARKLAAGFSQASLLALHIPNAGWG